MQVGSQDVTKRLPRAKKEQLVFNNQLKIWFFGGRIHTSDRIETRDMEDEHFFDANEVNYVVPTLIADTPLAYALTMEFHWQVLPQRGANAQSRGVTQIVNMI
jgi:hypothetical protein